MNCESRSFELAHQPQAHSLQKKNWEERVLVWLLLLALIYLSGHSNKRQQAVQTAEGGSVK